MSKNYIKILVNNNPVRSTGKVKGYRDSILKLFGCDFPFREYNGKPFTTEELNKIKHYMIAHIQRLECELLSHNRTFSPFYSEYHIRVLFMKRNRNKKYIKGEFFIPYYLRAHYDGLDVNYNLMPNHYNFGSMDEKLVFEKYPLSFVESDETAYAVLEILEKNSSQNIYLLN